MEYNNIFAIKQNVPKHASLNNFISESIPIFDDIQKIYSFIIYSNYKDETFVGWIIQYNISQIDEYNTIPVRQALFDILTLIKYDKNTDDNARKYIIGYCQPELDIQIKVYDPLIANLALKMNARWTALEYDDLYQTCRLCLILLYNKGYYIHKRLLEKSFSNAVLQSIRHKRYEPEIMSLYQKYNGDDKEKLTLADTIPDKEAEAQQALSDLNECDKEVYKKLRELIVDIVGERGYQELLRDYGNSHTSDVTRYLLRKIKDKFAKKGITIKTFNKYY